MFLKCPRKSLGQDHPESGPDHHSCVKCMQMTPTTGQGLWRKSTHPSFYKTFSDFEIMAISKEAAGSSHRL